MRVSLKGVNTVTRKLADGRRVSYYYAWKSGPRLEGKPGDAVFHASYNEAARGRRSALAPRATLSYLADSYQDSQEFAKLAPRTRSDYAAIIQLINKEFGDFPTKLLSDRRSRSDFLKWRDGLAKRSFRQADYAWTVLARVLSWAVNRGLATDNPCAKGGRLYDGGTRASKVWSADDESAFEAVANPGLVLALQMALWTGQRQGDLLALTWFAYDGQYIRLQQGKTGVRVTIPVAASLRELLETERRNASRDQRILRNGAGKPWTPDGFRASWGKACRQASIKGVTFHDLRGTAVTRLCQAGCSVAEIATITGHRLNDVHSILDANYFHRDVSLADAAVSRREAAEIANKTPK